MLLHNIIITKIVLEVCITKYANLLEIKRTDLCSIIVIIVQLSQLEF